MCDSVGKSCGGRIGLAEVSYTDFPVRLRLIGSEVITMLITEGASSQMCGLVAPEGKQGICKFSVSPLVVETEVVIVMISWKRYEMSNVILCL